jgi:hypothetical protein
VGIQYDGKDFIIADFAGGEPEAVGCYELARMDENELLPMGRLLAILQR